MTEPKFNKTIRNNAEFDSISWERVLNSIGYHGNLEVSGIQIGYYDKGTWPAFFMNHLNGTGHLESLGGHIWSEFATKPDYTFYTREGIRIGVRGKNHKGVGYRVTKPENLILYVANVVGERPFNFVPETDCRNGEIPYLQYLQVIDDNRVKDEYGPDAVRDLEERRGRGQKDGCVVKVTTISPAHNFTRNTKSPKTTFLFRSYDGSSLIHKLFGGQAKEEIHREIEKIIDESMRR